ncbi:MAG: hypothetical protein GY839_05795 [candidate division Zixibacteria bacterium]|nr:hypothetical protein [candidate division Zixibacteria bacterium]
MRLIILIFAAVMFVSSPATGQDKQPRDSDDKKEEKREKSGGKLDKIKDKISKKSKHDDDDDDSDDSIFAHFVFHFWWDINKHYRYTPYPYYKAGLLDRDSSLIRPLHFETSLSAFSGGSNIRAVNFNGKLKLYTIFGLEFQYNGFTEDDLMSGSELKMFRFGGVVNLLSHPNGYLELKFGAWDIADAGTGPLIGFEADIAPVYPVMLNFRADLSEINGHDIADYAFTFGYVYKRIEFFGGYRAFDLAGETIDGPIGGVTLRF